MPLRWQTSIETPAGFWEIPVEAPVHTIYCGLLKQPDKQDISNTGAGTILRVPVMRDGSAGTPEVYASSFQLPGIGTVGVDDFAFGSDGSIFAATQLGYIIRVHPNGTRTMISTGTRGDAAVAFGRTPFDLRDIYVVNNGGAFLGLPGGPLPASIVRITTNITGVAADHEW